ncbi:MAG TPA: TonB-dependent receptor [Candidatus Saccharicenans sp.]|nr:TonB-dependent receptor [Candidatus Saccharicenans sp.]HQM74005.1 TonB-dependent receptor [Candidatus Saccharicenans sp.]
MKKRLWVLFLGLVVLIAPLLAQDTLQTGSIEGVVVDTSGAGLPGVTVTISGQALIRKNLSTTTSTNGEFRFSFLPVGKYDLTFTLPGFKTTISKNVEVTLRKTTLVRITMEVSPVEETVTVLGESPVVDLKTYTVSANFTKEVLQKLPSSRDPWVIMEMTPGVVMDRQNVGGSTSGNQSSGYAYGSYRSQTVYNMDGVNMTDAAANGASAMYYDFDAIEEIQVETGAHSADIQPGGIVVNMITKSGGNKFSGGLSFYGETKDLQSNNIPDPATHPQYADVGSGNPLDYYYEYGGDFGGPIIKDKLWFYGSFRKTAINRYIIGYELDGVPQTDYSSLTHTTFKLTYQMSDKNRLAGWFYYDNKYQPNRGAGTTRPPETTFYQKSPSYFYHLEDTWTVNNNLILNFKLGINDMWYQTGPQPGVDMSQPAIRIRNDEYRNMYHNAYYNYTWYYSNRYQFNAFADYYLDDFLGGDHDLKVGFEYQNSPYHTTRRHPGNILLYWSYPDLTGPREVWTFRENIWKQTNLVYSAYFTDAWKLKKYFVITLGLRFDSTHMNINESRVEPNEWTNYYYERTGETQINYQPKVKNVIAWNTLAPRIGVTFDPLNNGVNIFKVYVARYFWQMSYGPVDQAISTGYWEVDYRWNDANGDKQPQTDEFGDIIYTEIGQPLVIDPNLKSPYTNEIVASYERKITRDFGARLSFISRKTKRFWWNDNLAIDPQLDYTPVQIQDPGPDGSWGTSDDGGMITVFNLDPEKLGAYDPYVTQQIGYETSYQGLELSLTKRYANKWQFMGSITYGKSNVRLPITAVDDPNNREFNDDVVTSTDVPIIIKLSGSYDLPGGFYIGAFFNYRRGYPAQRYFLYEDLNQGDVYVAAEKFGESRYPDLTLFDLRLSKIFNLKRYGKFEIMIDGFNIFNAHTPLSWDNESWEGYKQVTEILAPRIFRLGVKWNF